MQPPTIQVHSVGAAQRRMLLEMLASERAGEAALNVRNFGRRGIARGLIEEQMARSAGPDEIVFTEMGRLVAESLARRIVDRRHRVAC